MNPIKLFVGFFLVGLMITVFVYFAAFKIGIKVYNEASEGVEDVKSLVGEQVIINEDTLTVIDYSIFNGTYTLDNDKKYAVEFIKKLEILDETD